MPRYSYEMSVHCVRSQKSAPIVKTAVANEKLLTTPAQHTWTRGQPPMDSRPPSSRVNPLTIRTVDRLESSFTRAGSMHKERTSAVIYWHVPNCSVEHNTLVFHGSASGHDSATSIHVRSHHLSRLFGGTAVKGELRHPFHRNNYRGGNQLSRSSLYGCERVCIMVVAGTISVLFKWPLSGSEPGGRDAPPGASGLGTNGGGGFRVFTKSL